MILLYINIIKSIHIMLSNEYKIEILNNFKYQNQQLLKYYKLLITNINIIEDIVGKINYIDKKINNIFIVLILILQLFILFK